MRCNAFTFKKGINVVGLHKVKIFRISVDASPALNEYAQLKTEPIRKAEVAKLDENSENWQDYPHLVEWVDQMKKWAADYQIYEFIGADEDGQDPSGRIPVEFSYQRDENAGRLERHFIWTLEDNGASDGRIITSEFSSGMSRYNFGWYVGRVPHENGRLIFDAGKLACNKCEGQGFLEDSEGDEVDCELCEGGETSLYFRLEDTDFRVG